MKNYLFINWFIGLLICKNYIKKGEPIDDKGPLTSKKKYPIHREAPTFVE